MTTPLLGKSTCQRAIISTAHTMTDRHTIMEGSPQRITITDATSGIGGACTTLFRSHDHVGYTRNTGVANTHRATEWSRQDVDKHEPVATLVHCVGVMEPNSATNPQNTRNMTIN